MEPELDLTGNKKAAYDALSRRLHQFAAQEASENASEGTSSEAYTEVPSPQSNKLIPDSYEYEPPTLENDLRERNEPAQDPSFTSVAKKSAKKTSIIGTTTKTLEWLFSPLGVPGAISMAPIAHDYEESGFADQTAESFSVAGEAAFKAAFPIYGEEHPNYGYDIADKIFPNTSEFFKGSASLVFDIALDPGFFMGLLFGKVLQKGIYLTRLDLMAGKRIGFNGLMRRGMEELLLTTNFPEGDQDKLLKLADKVDAGDKVAAKALDKLLISPEYRRLFSVAEVQELKKFQDELIDSFGYTERAVLKDGTVVLQHEFNKEVAKITKDVQRNYVKSLKDNRISELTRQGFSKKDIKEAMKDFSVEPKQLNAAELDEIKELAHAAIRVKQANKYNMFIQSKITLSKLENQDYLNRIIENGDIFRTFKLRKGYITNENLDEALQVLADSYRQVYERYKHKGINKKLIQDRAADVPLEKITDKKAGVPWNQAEHFVAKSLLTTLNDEVGRLLLKHKQTGSPYDEIAVFQALEMLKKVVVRKADADYVWGSTGPVMEWALPANSSSKLNDLPGLMETIGRVQDDNKQQILQILGGFYGEAERSGKALNFISRAMGSPSLIEDILFESYVNANLSAITTSIKNVFSNSAMVALQPAERFLSTAWGNKQGFQEGYQMAVGISEGIRDVLYFWLDQTAKTKYGGKIIPDRAADAARVRMLEIGELGVYPLAYLKPTEVPLHEATLITKRKNLSAGNLGVDPDSWWGRRVDQTGKFVRLPGSILAYQDAAYKMVGFRADLRMKAWQEAKTIAGTDRNGFELYFKDALVRPGMEMQKSAMNFADYITFQKPLGKTTSDIQRLLQARYTRWFFPYVRTPINLIKVGMERTPLNTYTAFKELFLKNDPKAAQMAMARASMGTMVMWGAWTAFDETQIVGGYDITSEYGRRMRELKIPPYSIKINGKWYSYESVDFLRTTVGVVATAKRMLAQLDLENPAEVEAADKIMAVTLAPFVQNSIDQRWLNDVSKILYYIEALRGEDSFRTRSKSALGMVGQDIAGMAASAVPGSAFLKQFNRTFVDDESRAAERMLQEMAKVIPGLAKTIDMPSYRNLWGDPYIADETVGPDVFHKTKKFILPFKSSKEKLDVVSKELFDVPVRLPGLVRSIKGVRLDKKQQIKIQEYTGKGTGGMPLYDALSAVINSAEYQNASHKKGKAALLQNVLTRYVDAAKNKLLEDSQRDDPSPDSLYNRYVESIKYEQSLMMPK